jgi:hypothetical protein
MSTDQAAGGDDGPPPPLSASTPTRTEKQPFRIVDIESSSIFKNPGDVNSAEGSGDGNTAYTSDANSADANQVHSRNCGSAQLPADGGKTDSGSKDPKPGSSKKIPAMVKPPPKRLPMKIPAEADATPSSTYESIVSAKKHKLCPPAIPGTGPHNVNYSCGSFYNKGDNRVARTVYKENVASLSITSMSFNPTNWLCSACPKKPPILGGGANGGGGNHGIKKRVTWGEGGGRLVIVLADQNFPEVLPTCHFPNRTWKHEGIN